MEAFAAADISYVLKPKDGTFYAPKIDIYIDDALGREWQMATIQIDLTMLPERFDLTYIDEHGQPQRPIAIHRAIYGSLERFIGILVEHFAGAFPLWLAPVQAVVIPIADRHAEAAEELAGELRARGLRVEVDVSDNRMQNKIRLAQEQKVPYMLVLGDREVEARTVAPRARNAARGEQQEAVPWAELAERLAEEASARTVVRCPSPPSAHGDGCHVEACLVVVNAAPNSKIGRRPSTSGLQQAARVIDQGFSSVRRVDRLDPMRLAWAYRCGYPGFAALSITDADWARLSADLPSAGTCRKPRTPDAGTRPASTPPPADAPRDCRSGTAYAILPLRPESGSCLAAPVAECRQTKGNRPSVETCASIR